MKRVPLLIKSVIYGLGFCLMILVLIYGFYYLQYAKAVKNDTRRIFNEHKEFIYGTSFSGVIEEKHYCKNCEFNRYSLKIKLNSLSEKLNIGAIRYPPYYEFNGDSILKVSVSKNLFKKVKEADKILKDHDSYELIINKDFNMVLLSNEKNKWIP